VHEHIAAQPGRVGAFSIAFQILCQAVSVTLIAGIAKSRLKEVTAREKRPLPALAATAAARTGASRAEAEAPCAIRAGHMDADRRRRISFLYPEARARSETDRRAYLDSVCSDDTSLRQELDALLADNPLAEAELSVPARTVVAQRMGADDVPAASRAVAPDDVLGSYRIARLLGRGGMGAVFLAHDMRLHRPVALKILDSGGADAMAAMRLLREARNAAALNHPHICTVHEVGDTDRGAFIAMEYVGGRSLRDVIDAGALPPPDAVRLGIQAADALAYAHEHGVVHRDFKAANAMLTDDGRLKVVDFGLARREDALIAGATTIASLVPAGVAAGTPYAMAPEQVRGEVAEARSDIWALGVLLYEMVTGAAPFGGATVPELLSSVLTNRPATLPDRVPVELRAVIERCLQKDPARRYQSARDVQTALEAIHAGTVAPWVAWRHHLRRRPRMAAVAALLTIAAVLLGVNVGGVRDRMTGAPPARASIRLAVLPFENLTGDPEQEYFSDGLTDELITQLGRLHPERLSVIARTSSMRYKGGGTPIDKIGRELGVDYVLEGSARREGSRMRIGATLVQVRDQTQRWADSFDRELAGVLSLQHDVASGVAQSLAITLLPAEQTRFAAARPVNPEAYEAYLKGRFHYEKLTPSDLDQAMQYFDLALQRDPSYAPVYAAMASVWIARNQMGYVPPSEAIPPARAAAEKALALDGGMAAAHYALASVAWAEWDWETGEREVRRAIEIDPSDPRFLVGHAVFLKVLNRPEEAVAQAERARLLDPLNPFNQAPYGTMLYFARRFEEAVVQLRSALGTSPGLPSAHCMLWHAFNITARHEEALASASVCVGHYSPDVGEVLAQGYSAAGYSGAMRRLADHLARGGRDVYVAPIDVFIPYLYAGDVDAALEWLSKSVDVRDPNVPSAVKDPFANDRLRGDPRFRDIVRRTGLPH
jgi:eukaryotic-like serine/threonine-protein kinase